MTMKEGIRARPFSAALIALLWVVAAEASAKAPRWDTWIAYSPGGMISSSIPQGDGSAIISGGGLRPPIFSVRLRGIREDGSLDIDVLSPGGFDQHHIRTADMSPDGWADVPASDPGLREARLESALTHHRPIVRVRIGRGGMTDVRDSPALRHHEACARRLLRAAIEAQIAAAENEVQRESQQKRLRTDYLASVAPPVEHASRLVQLALLSLPTAPNAYDGALKQIAASGPLTGQYAWRAAQIGSHGRPVRLQLDMLRSGDSPAARLCRALTFREISGPSSDTCTIEGIIDRRDGWPLTLLITRKGETADGAKESNSRSFHRLAPLEGYVLPPRPCAPR